MTKLKPPKDLVKTKSKDERDKTKVRKNRINKIEFNPTNNHKITSMFKKKSIEPDIDILWWLLGMPGSLVRIQILRLADTLPGI